MEFPNQSPVDVSEIRDELRRRLDGWLGIPPVPPKEAPERPANVIARRRLLAAEAFEGTLRFGDGLVGRLPPQPSPPTARGRLGAFLVRMVGRMLFWYTPQIHDFQKNVAAVLREQSNAIENLGGEIDFLTREVATLAGQRSAGQASLRTLRREIENLRADQLSRADAPSSGDLPAAMSLRLHNLFRGSRAEIKHRLQVYIPVVEMAAPPVLDLGCGRGEWLELLKDHGVEAQGIDSNAEMVRECIADGLTAHHGDVLDFLHREPSNSMGVITGFHIVEHMPFAALLNLVQETVRVLRPGGLVIFETPDPENVLVGTNSFHYDPTHMKPLPQRLLTFVFEEAGLCRLDMLHLHPDPRYIENQEAASPVEALVNRYFYGPKDYGLIGWKPYRSLTP